VSLFNESGERIRGLANEEAAEQALARVRLSGEGTAPEVEQDWIVARVCSEYLQHCERRLAAGSVSRSHRNSAMAYLNDLCGYCGALSVAELKKRHLETWIEQHPGWRSPATHRGVIAIVQAAFNRVEQQFDVANPLKGIKKPPVQPRLHSFSPDDERAIYGATEECFRNFLFAAIHTGLRPFCELAKLTADQVEISDRGMMWRIYSSKTKKTRKIPVRPEVARLTRELIKATPLGSRMPLFRNSQGNPWTKVAAKDRMFLLKRRLGWNIDATRHGYSCYTSRHTFAHRMLSGYWNDGAGCSIEVLAELMGNTAKTSTTTTARNGPSTTRIRFGRRLASDRVKRHARTMNSVQRGGDSAARCLCRQSSRGCSAKF
jgi:integrase